MNKTRKIASVLLTFAVLCSCFFMTAIQASAKVITEETGDCYYTYNTKTKVMRIYGNGKMGKHSFYGTAEENMKKLIVEEGVTYVCGDAFWSCNELTKVYISSTVEKIKGNKISGAEYSGNLKSIDVSKKNKNYSSKGGVLFNKKKTVLYQYPNKKSTPKYKVPQSVKTISVSSFWYSSKLKAVTMGDKVTKVGKYAFAGCESLTTVKMSKKLKTISEKAFSACVKLKKIIMGKKISKIGAGAFEFCESISGYLNLPKSTTNVGRNAFYSCINLKGVVTTNNLKKIGDGSFGYVRVALDEYFDKNFTIYGKSGSAAQKYAKKYGLKFVII